MVTRRAGAWLEGEAYLFLNDFGGFFSPIRRQSTPFKVWKSSRCRDDDVNF